jgi:4-diphosphocytidyl-2-C-methyl-D-erythritol kinase
MKRSDITENAYAKLNLSLDVLGKRDDGYHEMLMIMQTISLCDRIKLTIEDGDGTISVSTNRSYLPNNEKNLGFKAASVFLSQQGIDNVNVSIDIEKHTPVCAGMGGGSSDAAAVLRALNRGLNTNLSCEELCRMAELVGSDVPFCVKGGTALAKGRGTEIEEIADLFDCGIVAVKPYFSVSTPALFSKIDSVKVMVHPDTQGLIKAIEENNFDEAVRRCFNVFEDALAFKEKHTVQSAKDALLTHGASCACMTGTGSAVFGIFKDYELAQNAYAELSKEYEECFLTKPVGKLL